MNSVKNLLGSLDFALSVGTPFVLLAQCIVGLTYGHHVMPYFLPFFLSQLSLRWLVPSELKKA